MLKFLELSRVGKEAIPFDDLFKANKPVVLRGLVADWELVKASKQSANDVMMALEGQYNGHQTGVYVAPAGSNARFFYNHDLSGFNYQSKSASLTEVFNDIRSYQGDNEHPYVYINSLRVAEAFPKLHETDDLNFSHAVFEGNRPLSKIWIGTESIASTHFDIPNNIACCVQGKRRFTLFPPEQVHNLYPGPMDLTPGGQVVSMADLRNPDYEQFPRLRQALDQAIVIDLEPGDALYYPSMWWHQVEALSSFNVMINYWWTTVLGYMGNPWDVVLHSILSIRDRPEEEKKAWQSILDFYVFGAAETPRAHLPPDAQGVLSDVDGSSARRLRSVLRANLNR